MPNIIAPPQQSLIATPTVDLGGILEKITAAQDKANTANEKRYADILSFLGNLSSTVGKEGLGGEMNALMQKMGETGRARIAKQEIAAQAATEQDLTTRGLGSTTIRASAKRGVASEAEQARQSLEEQVATQQASAIGSQIQTQLSLGQMRAGVMERREDRGPDLATFASLIQAAASAEKAAGGQRSATIMGPMAQAGRTGLGQPFRYAGAPSTLGGGGGGLGSTGGGGGGGGGTPSQRGVTSGAIGGGLDLGTSRMLGAGEGGAAAAPLQPAAPAGAAGSMSITPSPQTEGRPLTESETNIQAYLREQGFQTQPSQTPGEAFEVTGGEQAEDGGMITNYSEYKQLAGPKAVSATYFHNVWRGRVKRSTLKP